MDNGNTILSSNALQAFRMQFAENNNLLSRFEPLEKDHIVSASINELLHSTDLHALGFSILLLGAIQSRRPIFWLSEKKWKDYLNEFIKHNPMVKVQQEMSSKRWINQFLAVLQEGRTPLLKCLIPPSTKGDNERRAGTYTINFPMVTSHLEWWESRFQTILSQLPLKQVIHQRSEFTKNDEQYIEKLARLSKNPKNIQIAAKCYNLDVEEFLKLDSINKLTTMATLAVRDIGAFPEGLGNTPADLLEMCDEDLVVTLETFFKNNPQWLSVVNQIFEGVGQ